jgi:hypothetical protein
MTLSFIIHPFILASLNSSPSHRYSETQTCPNGVRYRDWICTYASPDALEKCRLDSHVLSIASYHQAFVPWKRDHSRTLEWICVRSSLPLEQRVLHDRSEPSTQRFQAFVRSVKARLLQDLKSLPLPDTVDPPSPDQPHPIDRQNVSTYTDEASSQVLVVYAPNGATQLEFVSMSLVGPQ